MSSWETSEKERFRQEEGGRKGKRGLGQGGGSSERESQREADRGKWGERGRDRRKARFRKKNHWGREIYPSALAI